uniref:Uncharacterized protein n=1 Tax=Parascaris univalens TaxID=6257 RepID=A0A915A8J7_PARUN
AIREQLQQNSEIMNEKVERIEEKLENAQLISGVAMENLRKLYDDEALSQKQRYDKTLDDHIRNSLKNEQNLRQQIEEIKRDAYLERNRLIHSFNYTEDNLQAFIRKQQRRIDQLEETIKLGDQELHQMHLSHEKQLQNMKEKQEAVKDNHAKETAELESELVLLKTTCIILTEERDEALNATNDSERKLETSLREVAELNKQIEQERKKTENERSRVKELEDRLAANVEKIAKLTNRLAATQKELQNEKAQARSSQRKLQEMNAKIDELSKNVYNSRKLEHSVLSLIRFVDKK